MGAFALGILQDQLQDFSEHWMLFLGIFIIVIVLVLPHGIAGAIKRFTRSAETSK
jgi:branched-chain amino acid transport system permease protein